MKLRNKITGEIENVTILSSDRVIHGIVEKSDGVQCMFGYTVQQFTDEWEDAPKEEVWYLGKRIGNYSMPIKEADIVTEKILAWKRLKSCGFKFDGVEVFSEGLLGIDGVLPALKGADNAERLKIIDDLDLLFGGEE